MYIYLFILLYIYIYIMNYQFRSKSDVYSVILFLYNIYLIFFNVKIKNIIGTVIVENVIPKG